MRVGRNGLLRRGRVVTPPAIISKRRCTHQRSAAVRTVAGSAIYQAA